MWQNVWNWLEACCITRVLVNYNNFKNWRFFFSQSELYKIRIKKIYFFNCIIEIFPICWRFTRLLKISLNFRYIFVLTFPTTAFALYHRIYLHLVQKWAMQWFLWMFYLFLPALVVVGVRVGFTGGGLGVVQTLATLSRLVLTGIAVPITLTSTN